MDLVVQALINGLVSGALLAVPAIGFTAMFAVLRFPNFSVSGIATLGAFAGYVAYGAGLQMAGSLVMAFAVAGAVGLFLDRVAHQPLVKQGALPAAIASIASGLVLENVVRLGFGNDMRGYDRPIARDVHFGDIRVSPQQLETMLLRSQCTVETKRQRISDTAVNKAIPLVERCCRPEISKPLSTCRRVAADLLM